MRKELKSGWHNLSRKENDIKMNREKALLKNMIILSFGTVIPKVANLITLPIITGCLVKVEYGIYDLTLTVVSLFLPIATMQMQAAAFRFLLNIRGDIGRIKELISNIIIFTILTSLIALTILYFALHNLSYSLRILIAAYYFTDIIVVTLRQIARGLSYTIVYSVSVLISTFCELILIIFLLLGLNQGLSGALLTLILSLFVSIIYLSHKIKIFSFIKFRYISKTIIKELIAYSWPMIPNSLSSWAINLSDRLIVTAVLGVTANAVYAVANKLPNLFGIVQSTFNLAWQENASITVKDDDSSIYYGKMFNITFKVLVGMMALLIGCTPVLFTILIKGDYSEAYLHIPILLIAALFSSLSSYLGGIYIAHKRTKEIGFTTMFAAVVNIIINFLLINKIGIFAASLSTVLSYLMLVLYRMINIQKIQKIKFDFKLMLFGVSILIIMCFICSLRNNRLNMINFCIALFLAYGMNYQYILLIVKKLGMLSKKNIR